MRKSVALALVALSVGGLPAGAEDRRPGEKWLECYVGGGGQATKAELYAAVANALDAGDADALRALATDRCTWFRLIEGVGWNAAEASRERLADITADAMMSVRARLEVEGVRLGDKLLGDALLDFHESRGEVTGEGAPLGLRFPAVSVDGRWFLTGLPSMPAGGERVVERAKSLLGALGDTLVKHQANPGAAAKAFDGWWKKSGAELERMMRAGHTLRGAAADELQTLRKAFFEKLGTLADDPGIRESLAALKRPRNEWIGVAECDDYINQAMACIAEAPEEIRTVMQGALGQVTSAWRDAVRTPEGRASLVAGCAAARDAFKEAAAALCPSMELRR